MSSVLLGNQKSGAISRDGRDVTVDRLIELAASNPGLRRILVRALLDPAYCVERPQIETGRLLAALKVADLAGSTVQGKLGEIFAFERWRAVWNLLLSILREQLVQPLLSSRDVTQLRLCLNQLQTWSPAKVTLDWEGIEKDLKTLEATAKEHDGLPKSLPRRGRKMSRHQRHIVAAVELLRQCGVRDPSQKVAGELFKSFGTNRGAQTVLNLWSAYKKYPRRFPEREAMPHYHLKAILWFVWPAVTVWGEKAGIAIVAPGRS
jgi:hypothetical protein